MAQKITQHFRPACPEGKANQGEPPHTKKKNATKPALGEPNPKKWSKKRVPQDCGEQWRQHRVKGGKGEALAAPRIVREPRFFGSRSQLTPIPGFPHNSADPVHEKEYSAQRKERPYQSDHPGRGMLLSRHKIKRGGKGERATEQKRESQQDGLPSIDRCSALRRMVLQHGRIPGHHAKAGGLNPWIHGCRQNRLR